MQEQHIQSLGFFENVENMKKNIKKLWKEEKKTEQSH